jgi:PAS domain S-box-containing protein
MELKENEERFRSLSNAAFEGIGIAKDGIIIDTNAAFTSLFGYEPDEMIGQEVKMLVAPEDRKLVLENIRFGYEKPYEHKALRKDGSILDVEVCGKTVLIKGQACRITAVRDITERKKAEEKLLDYQSKLKSLASQLSVTEERERRRIATDLHDQIGQPLVFSKLKLDELQHSTNSSELTKALIEISNNIDKVIQDTRTLTFDLSSPILNEIGFETAVSEWLDEQIGRNHGIKTEFEDDGQAKLLDDDIRALLFRNVRELLVNVVKHAKAHNVKVSISKVDSQICVRVEDDGVGFKSAEVASLATENGGFGIFSIRERLEQLGGHLEIDSENGRGSKIMMMAPLKLIKSQS